MGEMVTEPFWSEGFGVKLVERESVQWVLGEAAMAKIQVADRLDKTVDTAIQLTGARGVFAGYGRRMDLPVMQGRPAPGRRRIGSAHDGPGAEPHEGRQRFLAVGVGGRPPYFIASKVPPVRTVIVLRTRCQFGVSAASFHAFDCGMSGDSSS